MEPSIWERVRARRSLKGSLIGYVPFLLIVGIAYVATDSQLLTFLAVALAEFVRRLVAGSVDPQPPKQRIST